MPDAPAAPGPLIAFDGASFGYAPRAPVLRDVTLEVARGDFVAVIGPNGGGKSTLLRAILGILPPLEGAARRAPGERAGYVPQRQALDPIWPLRALDIVLMGLAREVGPLRRPGAEHRSRALLALEEAGMAAHAERPYRDLSGGQQQRTLIARALVSAPDLLVLDEPTSDLDLAGEHGILEVIARLHREGKTVVLVTHALHLAAAYAHRIALVRDGRVEVGPLADMLTPERLSPLYGGPVVVADAGGRKVVLPVATPCDVPGHGAN
jgi:ABC-type Mn2+/Zn2+ transport system ATPase subunit